MFKIAWKKKAYKQLRKIGNQQDSETIYNSVSELSNWPDCKNVKSMVNHERAYRLRVGRYRILFNADERTKIIEIQEVKKRDERTY
jgi:mRNA-degrading endonuclease RelE of RelBE toxin-antitoxin system